MTMPPPAPVDVRRSTDSHGNVTLDIGVNGAPALGVIVGPGDAVHVGHWPDGGEWVTLLDTRPASIVAITWRSVLPVLAEHLAFDKRYAARKGHTVTEWQDTGLDGHLVTLTRIDTADGIALALYETRR